MEDSIELTSSFREVNASFVGFAKRQTSFQNKAEIFYYTGSESPCLNCFIVMQLQTNESGEEEVKLLWTYPYTPAMTLSKYPNLGKFAMANAGVSYSVEELSYTFVLTDSSGLREYGHTTAFVNGEAVVALSPYPWCNFFYRLAYLYRSNGEEGGRSIIRAFCRCGTPPSGAVFSTPRDLSMTFRRPYDRLCSFVDTSPLDLLVMFPRIDDLFSVLADLLLEKHIVVVGPNFSLVANVVMSLQALIAPFDWMHILIPILPTSLLDVLAAPPPYLVGILTSQLPLIQRIPMDSVVFVHIGASGMCESVEYMNETPDHLPHSGMFSALRIGLSILRLRHPKDQTVRDVCSLFLTYYASLFGEVVLKGGRGYIKTHNLSVQTRVFFEKLLNTQSFNILSEEVKKALASTSSKVWMDNEFIVAAVRAHPEVFRRHYEELIEEERQGGGFVEKYEDCFGSKENFTSFTAALHGFGGHHLGVSRLLFRCLCGQCCDTEGNDEDGAYQPGGRMGQAILQRRYKSASSGIPVIEDLPVSSGVGGSSGLSGRDPSAPREFNMSFSPGMSNNASSPEQSTGVDDVVVSTTKRGGGA